jgi:hypothetical protein
VATNWGLIFMVDWKKIRNDFPALERMVVQLSTWTVHVWHSNLDRSLM